MIFYTKFLNPYSKTYPPTVPKFALDIKRVSRCRLLKNREMKDKVESECYQWLV